MRTAARAFALAAALVASRGRSSGAGPAVEATPASGASTKAVRTTAQAQLPASTGPRAALSVDLGDPMDVRVPKSASPKTLKTCDDYLALPPGDIETVNVIDQRFFLSAMAHCQALGLLARARPSARSFLDGFAFDASALELLPAELRPDPSGRAPSGGTWKQVDKKLRATAKEAAVLAIGGRGYKVVAREYGRGDIDGDGIEDLVVRTEATVVGGTYEEHAAYALTRTEAGRPLRVIARWRGGY